MSHVTVPLDSEATVAMRVDRADGRPSTFFKQVDGVNVEIDEAEYESLNGPKGDD